MDGIGRSDWRGAALSAADRPGRAGLMSQVTRVARPALYSPPHVWPAHA